MPDETETEVDERSILEQLREQRSTLLNTAVTALEARKTVRAAFVEREKGDEADRPSDEDRSQFDAEEQAFTEAYDKRKAELSELDKRIDEEDLVARRKGDAERASVAETSPDVQVISEPLTYERGNGRSYFRDMAIQTMPGVRSQLADGAAEERMVAHAKEMRVEYPKIAEERERRGRREADRAERRITSELSGPLGIRAHGLEENPFVGSSLEQRVNPNRLDGQGGFFVLDTSYDSKYEVLGCLAA